MAGFLTDYANNRVLDCLFGGRPLDTPRELHVGLSLTRAFKGGYVAEPAGGGYARVAVPNDLAQFPAATLGRKLNAQAIAFPTPREDWGRVASVFVADSAQGGNVLAMADLPTPRPVAAGDPGPTIPVAAFFFSHH